MTDTVAITGLERTGYTETTLQGHAILAYFTAKVGVFTLKGCCLVKTNRGSMAVWLPNITDKKLRNFRQISLDDQPTKDALLQRALKTYRLMGGTEERREAEMQTMQPPPNRPLAEHRDPAPLADQEANLPVEPDSDPRVAELARMLPPPIRQPLAVKRTIETVTRPKEPAE
jgi:hypothetical protein